MIKGSSEGFKEPILIDHVGKFQFYTKCDAKLLLSRRIADGQKYFSGWCG